MKTLKHLSLVGLFLLILINCSENLASGAEMVRGVTPDSIRIGLGAPLTKILAHAGRQSVEATKAYINHINEMGGVHGRKIVLIIDDSQLDPSIALGILKKQLTNDNIFLHFSWGTPTSGALIKPVTEEKVPLLILGGAKSFYIPPKKYVFCFMPPYEVQAATCVTYIHDVLKKKDAKIAIFWRNEDYGKTALFGVKTAAKYYKYDVVAEPSYMLGQAIDFTSEVMKIKHSKADFVLLGSAGGDVSAFLREAKNQGLKATIIGALSPTSERKIISQAGDAAENYHAVFTTSMFRETNIQGIKTMLEISTKYVSNDILAEESVYYIYMFQPFQVIVEGLKRAGKNPTTEAFLKGLESIKGQTGDGLGPPISFTPTKHYSAESCFIGKTNMNIKDFDRITDWLKPPQDLIDQILKE